MPGDDEIKILRAKPRKRLIHVPHHRPHNDGYGRVGAKFQGNQHFPESAGMALPADCARNLNTSF